MVSKLKLLVAIATIFSGHAVANVCNADPYSEVLFLSNYPIAEAFCMVLFPAPAVTRDRDGGRAEQLRHQTTKTGPCPYS
jgi:hypothetical protein